VVSGVGGCGGGTKTGQPTMPSKMQGMALPGDPKAGATVFREAGCGSCHTLAAAHSHGTVGPNLDEHFNTMKHMHPFEAVVRQVTNGGGGMPAFKGRLGKSEIRDVAAYVVTSTMGR